MPHPISNSGRFTSLFIFIQILYSSYLFLILAFAITLSAAASLGLICSIYDEAAPLHLSRLFDHSCSFRTYYFTAIHTIYVN